MDNPGLQDMRNPNPLAGVEPTPTPGEQSQEQPAVQNFASMFSEIAEKIIAQQETIIGPVAVEQAKQVKDLSVDWGEHHVDVSGNPQHAIDELVKKYKELFGQIAVQVSKEAAASILAQLPQDQRPQSLQG